jgi:hypothetical protein
VIVTAQRSKKHKAAKQLLKLLKAKFLAIQDFNYELGHPSHVWDDEQSISVRAVANFLLCDLILLAGILSAMLGYL